MPIEGAVGLSTITFFLKHGCKHRGSQDSPKAISDGLHPGAGNVADLDSLGADIPDIVRLHRNR